MTKSSSPKDNVGSYIRNHVIPAGLTVKEAASRLGIGRPALSNLLNGRAALSPDMAVRLEKSFGANRKALLDMQAASDLAKQRETQKAVAVRRYVPKFLRITARQIQSWAEQQHDARQLLPVLLRRLIHSTGHGLHRVDFPGYDNAERKGSDGIIESNSATAWIPDGKSYWEFGVSKDPQAKAEHDYQARSTSVAGMAAESTFVFATPRNWPGKEAWTKQKNALKEWKAVRALDASDLEQWLEESIPTQIWLAEMLGMQTAGYETLDHCWERWAAGSEPRMTPDIFAPSIEAHTKSFTEWLTKDIEKPYVVAADSRAEALAFLACLFEQTEVGSRFRDLVAVFSSPETLRTLVPSSSPFIPIVTTDEAERELALVYRNHHSIVVRPRNAVDSEPNIALDLLQDDAFENALAAMQITGDDADRLARESGRSPTILRRRLSPIDAIRSPSWAKDSDCSRALIPMMLIGAWNAKSNADTDVLSVLANRPYDQIEKSYTSLLQFDDAPVWSAGSYRGVASKIDALFAVSKSITAKDINEFFTLAEYVLSETDPALQLPEDERWAAGIYGKVRDHSVALRQGVCETLVILSVHGNSLFKSRLDIDVYARVGILIQKLLTPLTAEKLMSHERDLPRYAEAAPETFLRLLEADLNSSEPAVLRLLKPVGTGFLSGCPRTGLLWAIECLAWRPQGLLRIVSILAQLSRTRISDNWANTPIGSLESILRAWMPQTAASLEQRCKALEYLTAHYPDIGWEICVKQFDPRSRVGHYNYRPHWRSDASGAGQPIKTQKEISVFVQKALDLALSWSRHDENSLGDLVERLGGMAPQDRSALWALIEGWAADPNTTDHARATLRERIRRFALTRVGRRRVEDEITRGRARDLYGKLEPSEPVIRHRWLFEKQWVEESADELEDDDLNFTAREERIHAHRIAAFTDIWAQRGFDGVVKLLTEGDAASTVGRYAATCIPDTAARVEFMMRCLALCDIRELKADSCILGFLWSVDLVDRAALLRAVAELIDADQQVQLFKSSPFELITWQVVDEYGTEVATRYWMEVVPQWSLQHCDSGLNFLIDRLLGAKRPRAAFHAVHMNWERIETSRLKRLLMDVATVGAEHQGAYRLDPHAISEALQALDGRAGVTVNDMAQMEFHFASALDRSKHGIPNLELQICESPMLYMQIMALLWKRSDDGQDPPEWRVEDAERLRSIASAMYEVLQQMKRIPGTDVNGKVEASALLHWLNQVRALAAQYGRAEITDQCLGQLLAKAPPDGTGAWPSAPVCEAMESIASPEIARGFSVGVRNSRGAVWRGEGGAQERELAVRFRGLSENLAFRFPYVASALEAISAEYDSEAEWYDSRAAVSKRLQH